MVTYYRSREKNICSKSGASKFALTGSSAAAAGSWGGRQKFDSKLDFFFLIFVTFGGYYVFLAKHFNLQTKHWTQDIVISGKDKVEQGSELP